ncbi:MAG: hypothetical protein WDM88_06605 [Galbitalea sp.]
MSICTAVAPVTWIGASYFLAILGESARIELDERGRLGRVRRALGDDLQDGGVVGLVRQALADVLDVGEFLQLGADGVEVGFRSRSSG